jgi:hypothetical protein
MIGVGVLRRMGNGIHGFYLKLSSQNVINRIWTKILD